VSKTVREKKLDSPAARAKLKHSGKPYWRAIDTGIHLGYRKNLTGGKWVLRRYLGHQNYAVETIAAADDHSPADNDGTLDFFQAQRRARQVAIKAKPPSGKAAFTVASAMEAYFQRLKQEGSKSIVDARGRARIHILPNLSDVPVSGLTHNTISRWLTDMAGKVKDGDPGHDAIRARRASANRVLTILRAALNQAFRDGNAETDTAWRAVKPFKETNSPRLRYFTKDEVRRLINAAQGSFRDLVKAAVFSGCRYGELGRLRVGDFNRDSGTLLVGQSKSGKGRHVILTDEGQKFFETLTLGRPAESLMLTHGDGSAWGPSHQSKPMTQTCCAANVSRAGFHTWRHTAASHMVMGGTPLRANDDETKTCREFTLEGIGQTSSGYAPHQRQQDACSSRR
jgi:integrase